MSESQIVISLDDNGRSFFPGEKISGEYSLESFDYDDIKAIEVSVLWHTQGKGDEDLAVHEFRRIPAEELHWTALRRPGRFETVLPLSPLSYEGAILKIQWCVRVRVFTKRGKEYFSERPFVLGDIRPAKAVE